MSARSTKAGDATALTPTISSLRELALSQAAAWNDNADGLRDTGDLIGWRDNCRDEVRDEVHGIESGNALLEGWVNAFDGAVHSIDDLVDDAVGDIECAIATANDLLRLALDDLQLNTDTKADSAIRGAKRFIDDIGAVAVRLTVLTGFGKGGAA